MQMDRFTTNAQKAIAVAAEAARARHHQYLEPEHVLFALVSDEVEGIVRPLLNKLEVSPATVQQQMEAAR